MQVHNMDTNIVGRTQFQDAVLITLGREMGAYAEALGVKPEDLPEQFMAHPLGLMIGGEPFVRRP